MTTRISVAAQNAEIAAVTALLNGGTVQIRTGSQPASVATTASGTLLATLGLSATAFAAPSGGSATANTVTDASNAVAGTAGWFRAFTSGGVAVLDGAIGASAGTGIEMVLSKVAISAGESVKINSWTVSI
jgi:hypothetical protein